MQNLRKVFLNVAVVFVTITAALYVYFFADITSLQRNPLLRSQQRYCSCPQPQVSCPTVRTNHKIIAIGKTEEAVKRIIHQSWKTTKLPSQRMERWAKTWRDCFPDWKYMLWTDESNRALIAKHYPWFLVRYDDLPSNIVKADVSRFFYMFHHGGIYADLDTECVRPFTHLLNASVVLGAMDGHWILKSNIGHIQNSFMYSRPGHPIWLEMIVDVLRQPHRKGNVEAIAGPLLLMRILQKYEARGFSDVMTYPGRFFNPFSWLEPKNPNCLTGGRMSEVQYLRCKNSFVNAYVIQYHTKTWDGGKP